MSIKIELRDVVKLFGRRADGRALDLLRSGATNDEIRAETENVVGVAGVSLAIEQGEVFVVMGLSGSGKSTLIRCLNRIHEPTAGSVLIDGEDITTLDMREMLEVRRQKMAMVFQHFALFPHRSVLDNAGYGLKIQGVDDAERRERAMDALELVGLGDWASRYPHNLSGGMQQRVGLARALATDPEILLMDEAFSALDPLIRRQMQQELLQLQDRLQRTIVFITHDLNEALRVGSRVLIMKAGRAVQVGTPTEIVTEPADAYVADFMADVDHAKVLPASYIVRSVPTFPASTSIRDAVTALNGSEVGFVCDPEGRPIGSIDRAALSGAAGDVGSVATADFPQASEDASIASLFQFSGEGDHVALTDDDGRLVGAVAPLDILHALGEVEVTDPSVSSLSAEQVSP
jgi:glycine betaine/proline transport system ATP-binding protein